MIRCCVRRLGERSMSAAVKITRTDHDAPALRALAGKTRDTAQSRRLLALAMVLDGASREEAARQAGMDRQTLRIGCPATMQPGWTA
jgi:hypothetical protein